MLAQPVDQRDQLLPGLPDQAERCLVVQERASGPVVACGQRSVPEQFYPGMISRHAAGPGLEPMPLSLS